MRNGIEVVMYVWCVWDVNGGSLMMDAVVATEAGSWLGLGSLVTKQEAPDNRS